MSDTPMELPAVPDLSGKIPAPWQDLIREIGAVESDSRRALQLAAQVRVWTLFEDLAVRQQLQAESLKQSRDQAAAADRHAAAVTRATWVLALATLILAVATVVLVFVTAHA